MTTMTKPPEDNRSQEAKFRDMARQLEADEDEARFEEAARKVATAPVPEKQEPKK